MRALQQKGPGVHQTHQPDRFPTARSKAVHKGGEGGRVLRPALQSKFITVRPVQATAVNSQHATADAAYMHEAAYMHNNTCTTTHQPTPHTLPNSPRKPCMHLQHPAITCMPMCTPLYLCCDACKQGSSTQSPPQSGRGPPRNRCCTGSCSMTVPNECLLPTTAVFGPLGMQSQCDERAATKRSYSIVECTGTPVSW